MLSFLQLINWRDAKQELFANQIRLSKIEQKGRLVTQQVRVNETLKLLQIHYEAFAKIKPYADKYQHPHPTDTRGWSQIIVSSLTDIKGYSRKKGPDLEDGSDVKGANCWDAIDTPRFNNCIKAGTLSSTANTLESLDPMPFLFFVMWDTSETSKQKRCRIWVVRTQHDVEFRRIADKWYNLRASGEIKSDNFQLHPPRNLDNNIFRNNCGHLEYPLLFEARLENGKFILICCDESIMTSGECVQSNN